MEKGVAVALAPVEATGWVLLGIILSLVLPIAVKTLQRSKLEGLEKRLTLWERITKAWQKYGGNQYLGVILSATLVAVVLVFLLGLQFYTPRDAALAGFAWESLINKLFGKSQSVSESL
jgi:hypothetical protein